MCVSSRIPTHTHIHTHRNQYNIRIQKLTEQRRKQIQQGKNLAGHQRERSQTKRNRVPARTVVTGGWPAKYRTNWFAVWNVWENVCTRQCSPLLLEFHADHTKVLNGQNRKVWSEKSIRVKIYIVKVTVTVGHNQWTGNLMYSNFSCCQTATRNQLVKSYISSTVQSTLASGLLWSPVQSAGYKSSRCRVRCIESTVFFSMILPNYW